MGDEIEFGSHVFLFGESLEFFVEEAVVTRAPLTSATTKKTIVFNGASRVGGGGSGGVGVAAVALASAAAAWAVWSRAAATLRPSTA